MSNKKLIEAIEIEGHAYVKQLDGSYKPSESKTDWSRLQKMSDKQIEQSVVSDEDATPILTKEWFEKAELYNTPQKSKVSIRLDNSVIDWFKGQGKGYQGRMNSVLKAYVDLHPTK